ncbi:hypothetical protein [Maricaulis sp.]|uniref:hypothetical protein n=1 Tax=Maricaulis sp. TaxID=1486257 RepID=UPI003A8F1B58
MEIAHYVMCDEQVMLTQLSLSGQLDLETRGNPAWRMGKAISAGDAFPAIVNIGGRLEKRMLPILNNAEPVSIADPDNMRDWPQANRALIPLMGYRFKVVTSTGTPQYYLVRSSDDMDVLFVAAYWQASSDRRQIVSVRAVYTGAVGGRSELVSSEPLVMLANSAGAWLFPEGWAVPASANTKLKHSEYRRELVSA